MVASALPDVRATSFRPTLVSAGRPYGTAVSTYRSHLRNCVRRRKTLIDSRDRHVDRGNEPGRHEAAQKMATGLKRVKNGDSDLPLSTLAVFRSETSILASRICRSRHSIQADRV